VESNWLPERFEENSVLSFTITRGKIVEVEVIGDPERLRQLDLAVVD
jgi:hypothetical protein